MRRKEWKCQDSSGVQRDSYCSDFEWKLYVVSGVARRQKWGGGGTKFSESVKEGQNGVKKTKEKESYRGDGLMDRCPKSMMHFLYWI